MCRPISKVTSRKKRYNKATETAFASGDIDNICSHNNYPLYTAISVIAIVNSLTLAFFEGIYYLLSIPLIVALDRFFNISRRRRMDEMNKRLRNELKGSHKPDFKIIICVHCNKGTPGKLEFCINCGKV